MANVRSVRQKAHTNKKDKPNSNVKKTVQKDGDHPISSNAVVENVLLVKSSPEYLFRCPKTSSW